MNISVIIPTYNEQDKIRDCLESLSKQSYGDFEVIVVDDGSKDGTLDLIQDLGFRNYKLIILKQDHKGAGAARNLGAKKARGKILVFVDADMTFDKEFLEKLTKPIREGKTIGTFSKQELLANKGNTWAVLWNLNRGLPKDRMHNKNYSDKQKVFRAILKKEFDKAGGFNEKAGYIDDWSLSEKLGKEAINVPGAVFYHKNPESLREVFIQSKWMSKRKYKLGFLGSLFALLRVSFPISILLGVLYAIRYVNLKFLVFKIVSDLGSFLGIIEFMLFSKVVK